LSFSYKIIKGSILLSYTHKAQKKPRGYQAICKNKKTLLEEASFSSEGIIDMPISLG